MRPDLKMMLRGAGKFLAVALAAGIGGAAIGIGLAELTGDDASTPTPTTVSTEAQGSTASTGTATEPASTSTSTATTTTTTAAPPSGPRLVPRVQIQSARLDSGRVTAEVRVTNRYARELDLETPVLVSGDDEVALDREARGGAGALLETLDAGAAATGTLRFTLPSAVAQRLAASPSARLRIAGRTVALRLENASG